MVVSVQSELLVIVSMVDIVDEELASVGREELLVLIDLSFVLLAFLGNLRHAIDGLSNSQVIF